VKRRKRTGKKTKRKGGKNRKRGRGKAREALGLRARAKTGPGEEKPKAGGGLQSVEGRSSKRNTNSTGRIQRTLPKERKEKLQGLA